MDQIIRVLEMRGCYGCGFVKLAQDGINSRCAAWSRHGRAPSIFTPFCSHSQFRAMHHTMFRWPARANKYPSFPTNLAWADSSVARARGEIGHVLSLCNLVPKCFAPPGVSLVARIFVPSGPKKGEPLFQSRRSGLERQKDPPTPWRLAKRWS